jgi:K+-sensing histidine kinase KdpD
MLKKACVLVCVTSQPDCERLIRAGKKVADGEGVPLQVVSVQREEECFQPNSEALEHLHQQAKAVDAEMTIYFNDSPAITAAVHAVKEGAVNIVMGFPGENSAHFVEDVHLLAPEIPISMVDGDDKIYQMAPAAAPQTVRRR